MKTIAIRLSLALFVFTSAPATAGLIPLFDPQLPPTSNPILFTDGGTMDFDAMTRVFTHSTTLSGTGFLPDATPVDQISGTVFMSAIVDLDGHVTSGELTVFGTLPTLGITTASLLMSGHISALDIVDSGFGPGLDPVTQAIINIDFSVPILGFGPLVGFQHLTPGLGGPVDPDVFLTTIFDNSFSYGTTSFGDLFALPVAVTEPGSLALVVIGLAGIALARRRKIDVRR